MFIPITAPSAAPQNLIGSAQSDTIIDLTWTSPPAADINGIIRYYSILVEESETGRSWSFTHIEPEISVGSLHPYYNYECDVAGFTVGLGPYSNSTVIQTNEAGKSVCATFYETYSLISSYSTNLCSTWSSSDWNRLTLFSACLGSTSSRTQKWQNQTVPGSTDRDRNW